MSEIINDTFQLDEAGVLFKLGTKTTKVCRKFCDECIKFRPYKIAVGSALISYVSVFFDILVYLPINKNLSIRLIGDNEYGFYVLWNTYKEFTITKSGKVFIGMKGNSRECKAAISSIMKEIDHE